MTRTGELFDKIIAKHGLRNDTGLAERLEVEPTHISRVRNERAPLGATLILRMHELLDMPIAEIKRAAGLPSLPIAPACRIPSKAEALAQFVVQQFAAGILSQRMAAEAS